MNAIQAVLFDLDNTVLDRTATFRRFVDSFLRAYLPGLDSAATEEIAAQIIERDQDGYKDKRQLFAELLDELPWRAPPQLDELLDFYKSEYVNSAVPMDGAKEVLAHASGKYKTALVTNGQTAIQYGKIDRLGIRGDFDAIVVSQEAGVKKPDPRIFELALQRLGVKPEACVFVGDHPVNDIEGAARAGMKTIWLQVNQPWRDGLTATPLHTIRQLQDLLGLI